MTTFKSASVTEGTYKILGQDCPEIEIHSDAVNAGPATVSFLVHRSLNSVSFNIQNTNQGQSSSVVPLKEAEEFLTKCLAALQEKDNAQSI